MGYYFTNADSTNEWCYFARTWIFTIPTIHINTARNYLKELGYAYAKVKKRIYMNGYEREDVVTYWKIFLKRISELKHRIPVFLENNLEEITWSNNNI